MASATPTTSRIQHRMRSFLLVVCVSVLIAFAFLGVVFMVEGHWGHDALFKWGGLSLFTMVLFVFFIGASEKYLRSWRFWVGTAGLFVGHLAGFAFVLTHVDEWRVMWFMVVFFEYPIFVFLRERFVSPRGS
jgi:hypothetical protein